ncbi:MAG: LysM peptidoglycan-binding domain-containing protein, partial [Deltaproteobacteria bacterium]|nr:LysM peptidoglycan-binding domain-containing protein [Deltaproteobacteria bacterium]
RPGGSDKALLSAIDQRLQQLESRMAALEGIGEQVTDLDKNQQATQPLMVRLDRLETSFAKKISEMDQEIKKLKAKPMNTSAKQSQAPVVKSRASKPAVKTHVVKKGETLYSISKQYGLSVAQLMTFNKLSKGAVINPGQKLKIK